MTHLILSYILIILLLIALVFLYIFSFFFFFQAEDGIRDVAVTGVQTCALPISAGIAVGANISGSRILTNHSRSRPRDVTRSEERRVGKECRSRWSPYH